MKYSNYFNISKRLLNNDKHIIFNPENKIMGIIHISFIFLSIIAMFFLIIHSVINGASISKVVLFLIYSLSVIAYFVISGLLYILYVSPEVYARLKNIQVFTIPCMIIGTYIPFCFIILHKISGLLLFCFVCMCIFLRTQIKNKSDIISRIYTVFIVSTSCLTIIFLSHKITAIEMFYVYAGVLCYLIPIVLFSCKLFDYTHKNPGKKELSCMCTSIGIILHYILIYTCIT